MKEENIKPILEALVQGQQKMVEAIRENNVILENTLEATARTKKVEIEGAEVVTIKGDKGDDAEKVDEQKIIETVSEKIPKKEEIAAEVMKEVRPLIVAQVPTKNELIGELKPILEAMVPEDGEDGDDGEDADPKEIAAILKKDPSFIESTKGTPGKPGDDGDDGSPDTGTDIIGKIRSVKEGGLTSADIKDFDERMLRNKNMLGYLRELGDVEIVGEPSGALVLTWSTSKHKWIASSGGGIQPLAYDISSQFDGNLSTFTLPAYSAILMFNITGWPPNGALRPTVDFTTASSTTVALTGEVSAPESGATGIILYIPAS